MIKYGGKLMSLTLYWYPNCNTSKKAKKWLEEKGLTYKLVHLVEETPTEAEIKEMIENSDLPARRFFNTSGKVYREQNMKDKIKDATLDEMVGYLASNGMLIKRPIITDGEKVTVGYKEETLQETWA